MSDNATTGSLDASPWAPLRRYWPLILICVVGGTAIATLYARSLPVVYTAESVVVIARSTIPVDDVSNVAETIFQTDAVLDPVLEELDLDETPVSLLSTEQLSASSNVEGALEITATANSPEDAIDLANSAAESFESVSELRNIGQFSVFPAIGGNRVEPSLREAIALGPVVGAVVGFVLAFLWVLLRRPVTSEAQAVDRLHAESCMTIRVRALSTPWSKKRPSEASAIRPQSAVLSLASTVRGAHPGGGEIPCVIVGYNRIGRRTARTFIGALQNKLRSTIQNPVAGGSPGAPTEGSSGDDLTLEIDGAVPPDPPGVTSPHWHVSWRLFGDTGLLRYVEGAPLVVVAVPRGTRGALLDRVGEELEAGHQGRRIVVMIQPGFLR
nr:hypothetical protein [Actinomycetota bacterium]